MKNKLWFLAILFASSHVFAQDKIPGLEDLKNMAGCFDINYMFLEDGPHPKQFGGDSFYTFKSDSIEWVTVIQNPNNPYVVDVESFFYFDHIEPAGVTHHHAETWTYNPTSNSWKQRVYYVEDLGESDTVVERYSCEAPWIMHQRHCEAKLAAKPQRHKYTGRKYQGMDRSHVEHVTPYGWVQNSDNIIRNELRSDGTTRDSAEVGWIANVKKPNVKNVRECFPDKPLREYTKRKLQIQ